MTTPAVPSPRPPVGEKKEHGKGPTLRPPVVEFRDLWFTYPGPPPVTALRHCDLRIGHGDYVSIVGPSGSGKSSMLNVIGLLDAPTRGHYLLDGMDTATLHDADRTALRGRRIGFVFQSFSLLSYRSALENVMLATAYQGRRAVRERRAEAAEALAEVGLAHRLHAQSTSLSGGERQRVAIARALVARPSLLLCDEPTGNLDTRTTGEVLDLFDRFHDRGITMVVITHNPVVAERADYVLTMRDGVLSSEDTVGSR